MMVLIRTGNHRGELREMPSERVVASGAIDAVSAAAKLIAGRDWEFERLFDAASREIREQTDREVFGSRD